jgi:hypothetical protein
MTKLEIVIKTAVNHCLNLGRDTIIIVPTNLRTQAYSVFVQNYQEKKWSYNTGKGLLTLAVAEIKGEATPHYESVFIINPQDIEDSVLNEVKMIPVTDGLTICAKV